MNDAAPSATIVRVAYIFHSVYISSPAETIDEKFGEDRMLRRSLAALAALVVATVAQADDRPLKIGWIMSYTGPGASAGAITDASIAAFQKKYGDSVAGRKIEIIRRDTMGPAPDVARRLAQELIVGEKVDFLAGMDYTANTMAIAPLSTSAKIPLLIVNSATSGILAKHPYLTRFGFTTTSVAKEMAAYAAKTGLKNIYTFVHEFEPGLDAEAMFIREFKADGGNIAGSVRAPMKTTDFSPYVQRIKDAKPDAVFVMMAAGETPSIFLRQFKEAGADQSIKILGTGDIVDETNLQSAGDSAIGVVSAFHYTPTHDSALNKEFVAAFEEIAPGKTPNFMAATTYDVLHAIYEVVEKQNGNLDPDKTMELLKQIKFESPRGPIEIDPATRDIVQNIYFRKVEKVDNKLVNIEFSDVPNVKDPGSAR
jgi:branched-chain amino acid transport system substrate-binding protein